MQIAINAKNEITGYAEVGNIAGGFGCDINIPDDFAPTKYILKSVETEDGTEYSVIKNKRYAEPMPEITEEQRISAMEDAIAELIEMMLGGEE